MTINKDMFKVLGLCIVTSMLLVFASCRDQMEGLNKNLKGVSKEQLIPDGNQAKVLLPDMELNIRAVEPAPYQLQQNLGADMYSGYLQTATPFLGGTDNLTYSIVDGWVNSVWTVPRTTLDAWLGFKKKGYDKKYPYLYAVTLICKVFAAHRAADAFGPIPYSDYGKSSTPSFDSVEKEYNAFFSDLKQAVTILAKTLDEHPDASKNTQFKFTIDDHSTFAGDYTKWLKAANTLRLRLAMRMSKVEPAKAQKVAEAAVHQKYGLLETSDGSFAMVPPNANPLYTINGSWGDVRMGAPLVTILKGYHDPRLQKYALPAGDKAPKKVQGKIIGIRTGVKMAAKSVYVGFSQLNIQQNTPVKIMDAAESYFLRAEGALRGWNMRGTAQQFYEPGVQASFAENGLSGDQASKYLANNTGTQIPYKDPVNPDNDAPTLNHVTVKWNPGASFQKKLAKIIIQKWIAMYPEGDEAWAEFRRTGYPKQYPVKINNSEHIPDGKFIRRFPYTTTFTNSSEAQVKEAVNKYLGGEDNAWTRLPWEKKNLQ